MWSGVCTSSRPSRLVFHDKIVIGGAIFQDWDIVSADRIGKLFRAAVDHAYLQEWDSDWVEVLSINLMNVL
jgi:hypothetical protein